MDTLDATFLEKLSRLLPADNFVLDSAHGRLWYKLARSSASLAQAELDAKSKAVRALLSRLLKETPKS